LFIQIEPISFTYLLSIMVLRCYPFMSLQEPFPIGANVRVRPGKSRNAGNEENRNQAPTSTLTNGEESSSANGNSDWNCMEAGRQALTVEYCTIYNMSYDIIKPPCILTWGKGAQNFFAFRRGASLKVFGRWGT
jgi:hypothetical protein